MESCENHVAVKRGPVLYCLESADLPAGASVMQAAIRQGTELKPVWEPDLFGGTVVLEGDLVLRDPPDWEGPLYRAMGAGMERRVHTRLIPYYCWANRGPVEMAVWLPLA